MKWGSLDVRGRKDQVYIAMFRKMVGDGDGGGIEGVGLGCGRYLSYLYVCKGVVALRLIW